MVEDNENFEVSIKDRIKSAGDVQKEIVDLPEWDDVAIEVRTMTARQRAKMFSSCVDKKGDIINDKFQAAVLIACCYDPETEAPIFVAADESWLMDKSAGPIEKLANVAMRLSGLSKDITNDIEKNS